MARLETEIANQRAKKADLESRSYREQLEQDAERETRAAQERLQSVDGEFAQLEADDLPPKARILKEQIEAKRKDKAVLEDQRETDQIERIVAARKFMALAFAGYGKQGKAIFDALLLPVPEKKGKAA